MTVAASFRKFAVPYIIDVVWDTILINQQISRGSKVLAGYLTSQSTWPKELEHGTIDMMISSFDTSRLYCSGQMHVDNSTLLGVDIASLAISALAGLRTYLLHPAIVTCQ